jgi:hypothetical protein
MGFASRSLGANPLDGTRSRSGLWAMLSESAVRRRTITVVVVVLATTGGSLALLAAWTLLEPDWGP